MDCRLLALISVDPAEASPGEPRGNRRAIARERVADVFCLSSSLVDHIVILPRKTDTELRGTSALIALRLGRAHSAIIAPIFLCYYM